MFVHYLELAVRHLRRNPVLTGLMIATLAVVIILLLHIDLWSSLWQLHAVARWNWAGIAAALLSAALLFYAAVLSAPELEGDGEIDLWAIHPGGRTVLDAVEAAFALPQPVRYVGAAADLTIVEGGHDTFMISKKITRTYYILSGEGYFTIDGRRYDVSSGMVVEIPPKVEQSYSGRMRLIAFCTPR